jgi:tetratricopeptide (TPR) repeat protein
MNGTKTMCDTCRRRSIFSEALAERAGHMTPIRGRFLLSLKCCHDSPSRVGVELGAGKHVMVGNSLAILGLWEDASHQWRRAVQLDPLNSDAYNNLAVAYDLDGQSALAESEYERALALEPTNVYIRQNYELHRAHEKGRTLERQVKFTGTDLRH